MDSLPLLHDLALSMHEVGDISATLTTALNLMAAHLPIKRGSIVLISPHTNEIRIESSIGLNKDEEERGRYVKGEGITGRVIESGKPIIVSNISQDPFFLNKTKSRDLSDESLAFLCVPIIVQQDIVGALSVDYPSTDTHSLQNIVQLLEIIASLLGHAAMETQLRMASRDQTTNPPGFIGHSSAMRHVYQLIHQVAQSQATVLLFGESGTGKEVCARAIHAISPRANAPFISLNCAAIPESLIESELFGHERGAFTNAHTMRKGRFELANHGTLFLDEIGELSLLTQAKLLRVLQNSTFERIGGMETHRVDVRIVCATNRDLPAMVEEGSFRQDLFYRIHVFPITLPPLRERPDDILELCHHFMHKFARENHHQPFRLSSEAMDLLQHYAWPGNVRELENVLLRSILLAGHETTIYPHHLPQSLRKEPEECASPLPLSVQVENLEKTAIINALRKQQGRLCHAATMLGLTERVLRFKMQKYGLSYKTFRQNR
ncbi:MAG: sigma 54-interacting transcriptional regulator [Desulfovibrio sp.]|nr:sigma 54-interacting transcriptional regulator [Desulfovibrio sp.]